MFFETNDGPHFLEGEREGNLPVPSGFRLNLAGQPAPQVSTDVRCAVSEVRSNNEEKK